MQRFNGFARSGTDTDFKRGESTTGPGDLVTKGRRRHRLHGRALRYDGSIIEGLHAAGNASAPMMGHTIPARVARSDRR